MERHSLQIVSLTLGALALGCWAITFMAGTDVWHDAGRPDFLKLGATDFDLHALAAAYYLLPAMLLGQVGFLALSLTRSFRAARSSAGS